MHVKDFFASLRKELALLRPRYAVRRSEHATLAQYPTMRALLATTAVIKVGKKRCVRPEGAAVLCALVDLHRRTRDRLWAALLLRAFRPMLRALARRLIGASRDERLGALLASFHEAVLRVDPARDPQRIAMYVRQETRRCVFRQLRKELDWEDVGFVDPDLCVDPATIEPPPLHGVWASRRPRPRGAAAALVGTVEERGGLWALVRREYGSLTAVEQARVYRRLQRRRHRAVRRLRERLGGDVDGARRPTDRPVRASAAAASVREVEA